MGENGTFSSSFLVIARLLVLLGFATRGESHSWLACVDYDEGSGTCHGYARNWFSVMEGRPFFTDRGRDNRPGVNFPEGLFCDPRKEARTDPISAAYDETYPMAVLQVGQTVRWRWPAKNHATVGVQRGVQVFISSEADATVDAFNPTPIAEMDFSNCAPRRASVGDADCQDTWVVPADTPPGLHTLMWWWEFNAGEFYNSCADVLIVSPGVPVPTNEPTNPTALPTPGPTPMVGTARAAAGPNAPHANKPRNFALHPRTNVRTTAPECGALACPPSLPQRQCL
mmetsp:Transcript_8788/g.17221  ORF Transcript_8788/g.17221 Transcript_8788/m.17221 type:complete len:284 (+) Transcript_8788:318-1169(+)